MHDSIFRVNQQSEEGSLYEYLHDLLLIMESISKAIDDVSTVRAVTSSSFKPTENARIDPSEPEVYIGGCI